MYESESTKSAESYRTITNKYDWLIEQPYFVISDNVHNMRQQATGNKTNNKFYAKNSINRYKTILDIIAAWL